MTEFEGTKEQAQELVDKFLCVDDNEDLFCDECGMSEKAAKLCALIAVDELIKSWDKDLYENCGASEYWQEVKQEIEKL
jgi:hypothetical protein